MELNEQQRDRFWSKIDKNGNNGCWIWKGLLSPSGYGRWRPSKRERLHSTHRVAFELLEGYLPPKGYVLDHLCEVRACANPSHLNPTTIWLNAVRGGKFGPKKYCKKGHERALSLTKDGRCKICRRIENMEKSRRYRLRKKLTTKP